MSLERAETSKSQASEKSEKSVTLETLGQAALAEEESGRFLKLSVSFGIWVWRMTGTYLREALDLHGFTAYSCARLVLHSICYPFHPWFGSSFLGSNFRAHH